MIERQYCASSYVIDFKNQKILLMYNKKLNKWLQPGGHIEGKETPIQTATREVHEETGINIKIIGPTFDNINYQPIAIEHYINKVGDMIDIQYLSIPLNFNLSNEEDNLVNWFSINTIENEKNIDEEIKIKAKTLYNQYKNLIK